MLLLLVVLLQGAQSYSAQRPCARPHAKRLAGLRAGFGNSIRPGKAKAKKATPEPKKAEPKAAEPVDASTCACHSGLPYELCCRPYHLDFRIPGKAPEDLLRARYAAYSMQDADFIMQTTHETHETHKTHAADPAAWKRLVLKGLPETRFVALRVLKSTPLEEGEHEIVFEADIRANAPRGGGGAEAVTLFERSQFTFDGAWFYSKASDMDARVTKGRGSSIY
ncbi:hypothetical protein M885DRAFT_519878 [Pelagophyceae sp. CCMP2097]|nr:hypothetical protein M885DRAFT_519878 [Pelagophyceae sp. CCMP2097]